MSWPVASFCLVAAVLAVGWVAYERSRPSARTVALIATLSALAALGRDAFAAIDEVKPITAMTFVVGYSLGPLPGFVVGALGMLASNVLLGQGPYTPWQMAAWGTVGLLGAVAGRLSRRRLPRVPLAIGCALAAAVAKEIMNLYTWTLSGVHTLAGFVATASLALPFDIVDVVSTLVFGLAFGPELARLLARSRARTTVRWEQAGAAGASLVALLICAGALAPAAKAAGVSRRQAISRASGYLLSAQNQDGGFGATPQSASTSMFTAWSAIGLAAGGHPPLSAKRDGHTVLDALRAQASSLSGAGAFERTMLALHASGLPAGTLAGRNLLGELLSYRQPDGSFEGDANITAFAILALRASGAGPADPPLAAAGRWLALQQNADGGFSFATRGASSDVDDTGAALQALVAAKAARPGEIARAVSYLRRAQSADGGFPQQKGGAPNAQSTAWAVQGLVAAGRLSAFSGRRSPLAYLEGLMAANGSVRYSQSSAQTPVWVTAEALAALAERPFPIAAPRSPASHPRRAARSRPSTSASAPGGTNSVSRRARSNSSASSSTSTTNSAGSPRSGDAGSRPSSTSISASRTSALRSSAPGSHSRTSKPPSRRASARSSGSTGALASPPAVSRAAAGAEQIASRCAAAISSLLRG